MKNLPSILLFLLFCISCVEPLVMDPLEEMPVVVQCVLERNSFTYLKDEEEQPVPVQYLDLYYARRPAEDNLRVIQDARVDVTDGDEHYLFRWNGSRWECPFLPRYGATYELMVTLPDQTIVQASTRFPDHCRLTGLTLYDWGGPTIGGTPVTNIYDARYFYLMQRGFAIPGTASPDSPSPHEAFLWIRFKQGEHTWKRLYTSHPGVDDCNICTGSWNQLDCVPQWRQNIVQRGYTQQNWDHYEEICFHLPLHDGFLRIHHPEHFQHQFGPDLLRYWSVGDLESTPGLLQEPESYPFLSSVFILGADFSPDVQTYGQPEYQFFIVSKEYDKYLKCIIDHSLIHGDEFTSLYSADPIYTNIHNGIGIFGAVLKQIYNIDNL